MEPNREAYRKLFHDMRNALAVIQGYAQLIVEAPAEPPEVKQYAGIITERSADLSRRVTGLSCLSREFQPYRSEPTPFLPVFRQWVRNSPFARSLQIVDEVTGEPSFPVSPDRWKTILNELGSNVQRFCPEPRLVHVRGSGQELIWQDEGPGVPDHLLPSLGQPFQAFPNRFAPSPGSGVGLAHCRRLVEEAGGDISFTNAVEGGLRITIRFPA